MSRPSLFGAALGLLCCVSASAHAAEPAAHPSPSSKPVTHATTTAKPVSPTIVGTIVSVDLSATPSLQVKTAKGTSLHVWLDGATALSQAGQPVKPSQLAAGQLVKVRYAEKEGKAIAKSIFIQPATPKN